MSPGAPLAASSSTTESPAMAYLPNGVRLAYVVLGNRRGDGATEPPILLNRPLGGSMALWGEFATRLATEFQVIAFDPRGVGKSSGIPPLFSTRKMAGDAVALLDFLRVPRAHVFGISLGGMVASWMAVDARDRMSRLILAATLSESTAISRRVVGHLGGLLRAFARHGVEAEVQLVREILSPEFRREHPARVQAIEAIVRRDPMSRRNLVLLGLAAATHDADCALRGNAERTLLLQGELDPIAGGVSQAELLRDLPNATLEVIAHAGHDLSLEAPVELADRILRFLRR
ncbi:MAG TPA: alpha/beta hydrolase [Polyangiaceae bacterium]|nr:alpha/beta hydrolase [Polyangiaceae bacterium]